MLLPESNKQYLIANCGCSPDDVLTIQEAACCHNTTYSVKRGRDSETWKPISREEALRLLGRKLWLNGLARSAFHGTAVRTADGENFVCFNTEWHTREKKGT